MNNIFIKALLISCFTYFQSCERQGDCGTEKVSVGVRIFNDSGAQQNFVYDSKNQRLLISEDSPNKIPESKIKNNIVFELKNGGELFQELWVSEQEITRKPGGNRFGPGKGTCEKARDNLRGNFLPRIAKEDFKSYTICRGEDWGWYQILAAGEKCTSPALSLTNEANEPMDEKPPTSFEGSDCVSFVSKHYEWNGNSPDQVSLTTSAHLQRKVSGSYTLECGSKNLWSASLPCSDSKFPPRLSADGVFANCADASGNIRKADPFQGGGRFGEEVFCLPDEKNRWIAISSEARQSKHYLFCTKPNVKYPWPWNIWPVENTPYKSCPDGQTAILGSGEADFRCE